MWTNKQLSKVLYNDVKNLTSILVCCKGPKSLAWNKVLYLWNNHLRHIFYTFIWESSANKHPTNWASLQWCEKLNFHFELPQWWQSSIFKETLKSYISLWRSLLTYIIHLYSNTICLQTLRSAAKEPSFCLQKQIHKLCLGEIIT